MPEELQLDRPAGPPTWTSGGVNGHAGSGNGQARTNAAEDPTVPVPIIEVAQTGAARASAEAAASAAASEAPEAPARQRTAQQVEAVAAQVLIAFSALVAGFLIFVFVASSLPAGRAQAGLERRFARPLSYGHAAIGGAIAYGTPVARLDIGSIGLHQIVVEGTTAQQLSDGPGHLVASPLPGQVGNAVIVAHRLAFGGPFSQLHRLPAGARIDVITGQGRFTYLVAKQRVVKANDVTPFEATTDNRLTLVTADNVQATERRVVVAELVGAAKPSPPGRPSVLRAGDGGLVAQTRGLGALAWWSELLLLVAVATVISYRRLPRWSSYLVTTPVVVLVAWLVYGNLARLLPGTL